MKKTVVVILIVVVLILMGIILNYINKSIRDYYFPKSKITSSFEFEKQ